uniref:Uncharacterized protein n=1 Tax=Anguilla anguilla TaxID=7936 RepID=A0A0E9SX76_ANGAN
MYLYPWVLAKLKPNFQYWSVVLMKLPTLSECLNFQQQYFHLMGEHEERIFPGTTTRKKLKKNCKATTGTQVSDGDTI